MPPPPTERDFAIANNCYNSTKFNGKMLNTNILNAKVEYFG